MWLPNLDIGRFRGTNSIQAKLNNSDDVKKKLTENPALLCKKRFCLSKFVSRVNNRHQVRLDYCE